MEEFVQQYPRDTAAPPSWSTGLTPPGEDFDTVLIELDMSRAPVLEVRGTARGPSGGTEPLAVSSAGRVLLVRRSEAIDGVDTFEPGTVIGLEPVSTPDSPERFIVRVVWRRKSDVSTEMTEEALVVARSPIPSLSDVFNARRSEAQKLLDDADPANPEENWNARFRVFLEAWDRETYRESDLVEHWTDVLGDGSRPRDEWVDCRMRALLGLQYALYGRAKKRCRGGVDGPEWPAVDAKHIDLIGSLHDRLFEDHLGPLDDQCVDRIGRSFLQFASGRFYCKTAIGGVDYKNAAPNSALLTAWPEFVSAVAAARGQRDLWYELLPAAVGSIIVLAHAYFVEYHPGFESYSWLSKRRGEPLDAARADVLMSRFRSFVRPAELAVEWQKAIRLLAPSRCGIAANVDRWDVLEAYFAPIS